MKDHFSKEGLIDKAEALTIISQTESLLRSEKNLLYIQDPITVVGDIHGQFYDFIKLLDLGGNPEKTKFLFLGDYVDRGMFSTEVVLLLYCLKINYPDTILMLRGNHESRTMTTNFSFRQECLYKYDLETYEAFMESFDALPLACVVNNSFLAVHGGISPDLVTLKDIESINRFTEPHKTGIFCDLLWSDPVDSHDGRIAEVYRSNESRGCSYFFGGEALKPILEKNDLLTVIRAHEAQKDGFKMHYWNGADFPSVITIFSAPNYCDIYKNKGAIIKFDNSTINIQQYNNSKHPYLLPDFMDVFEWSIPFVIDKVVSMLLEIIRPKRRSMIKFDEKSAFMLKELEEHLKNSDELSDEVIENVVKSLQSVRKVNEAILRGENLSPKSDEPSGLAVLNSDEVFKEIRNLDSINEKRPA